MTTKTTGMTNRKGGRFRATPAEIQIPDRLYFRIGDVAELLGVKPYVLRYWESEFPMISPQKSPSGQRVYQRGDVETLVIIKNLLYGERYSIEGAQKRIRELRKEAEPVPAPEVQSTLKVSQDLKNIAHELQSLAKISMSELFRY